MDYAEAFKGYDVPKNIKNITILISKRFAINGACDPMYISNVIAHICGMGDGQGGFTGESISMSKEIAERLQGSYGCNIIKSEIPELIHIIENGEIIKPVALERIKNFIQRLKQELSTCDEWRKDYLNKQINSLDRVLLEWS